jgi:hypothetical protein
LGSKEHLARKEAYFYTKLRSVISQQGIRSPYPYYVVLEDYGDRSSLFTLLGFKTGFRGVFILEDLGNYDSFSIGQPIPENYAQTAVKKLAHFHALNWNKPIPNLPYTIPEGYLQWFNFSPNMFTKYPNTKNVTNRLQLWEDHCRLFTEPQIKEALYTFSDQYPKVIKYFHNNPSSSGPLFKNTTFLHGDLQNVNLFFITQPSKDNPLNKDINDIIFCDWQSYGYGHPSTEFVYLLSQVEPDPDRDLRLMKIYYEELTKIVPPEVYPWPVFQREVEIRTLGLGVSTFNIFRESPEVSRKRRKNFGQSGGIGFEETINAALPRMHRFALVVEKWKRENIFDRIEDVNKQ